MELTGSYRIPASREAVWSGLTDAKTLQACIPGCESLDRVSDTRFEGVIGAKVGPIKASFSGGLAVTKQVRPESCTVAGEGSAGSSGGVAGTADVLLAEEGGETVLTYTANADVTGKIGQLGSRLLGGVARQTADAFFANFAREIASGPRHAPPLADAPPMIHEEPAEALAPTMEAPPLAAGSMATPGAILLQPHPIAPGGVPDVIEPEAIGAAEATDPRSAAVMTRILLIAAIVVVVGIGLYYALWQGQV